MNGLGWILALIFHILSLSSIPRTVGTTVGT
jgi:hypothetical protein